MCLCINVNVRFSQTSKEISASVASELANSGGCKLFCEWIKGFRFSSSRTHIYRVSNFEKVGVKRKHTYPGTNTYLGWCLLKVVGHVSQ